MLRPERHLPFNAGTDVSPGDVSLAIAVTFRVNDHPVPAVSGSVFPGHRQCLALQVAVPADPYRRHGVCRQDVEFILADDIALAIFK